MITEMHEALIAAKNALEKAKIQGCKVAVALAKVNAAIEKYEKGR